MTDTVEVTLEPGIKDIIPDITATKEETPQFEKEVQDTRVIFVPFEDFTGRINQTDYSYRKDIPAKIQKTEANIWLEAKKGYIK